MHTYLRSLLHHLYSYYLLHNDEREKIAAAAWGMGAPGYAPPSI